MSAHVVNLPPIRSTVEPPLTRLESAQAITTIALSILALTLLALGTHFAHLPSASLLSAKTTLNLSFLICIATGSIITFSLTLGLVSQQTFWKHVLLRLFQKVVNKAFMPGARHSWKNVNVPTREGLNLAGMWWPHPQPNSCGTALLFHPNATTSLGMSGWMNWYFEQGMNVLAITIRGYGESEGEVLGAAGEFDAYLDVKAAIDFLQNRGLNMSNTVAHGYSLGSAYAAAAGTFFGAERVVLDHAFTNLADVTARFIPFLSPHTIRPLLPFQGRSENGINEDGWDTLAKIRRMPAKLCVIQGESDWITPKHFGRQLAQAGNGTLITVPGGHFKVDWFVNDLACQKLQTFLRDS